MKPASFDYVRPGSLGEALQALSTHRNNGKILAGGQSLVPMMNMRVVRPGVLIDINRVPGLDGIRVDGGELVIGALARHSRLLESELVAKHCPLMVEAYHHVAHKPIRNRGTIGGNISHADPASEMPAVLVAADGTIVAKRTTGERRITAASFFTGPMQTALAADEMVVEIRIPAAPAGQGWAFEEEANRKGDFAMAAIAATVLVKGGKCERAAIAVAGMGDHAARLPAAEAVLKGKALDAATIAAAAAHARDSVDPSGSYHADPQYKRDLVAALVERALSRAAARAK
ncbi:MAG: xanthine dehydrogenase family protein subunit M [Burkholderiales bacterium]|nr:xanthine dehydrogenase family protein subunit M [Burkholderiales bacterium]